LNQRLGLGALVLGALAVFANVAPARTVRVHEKEILTGVELQQDHVTPAELAAWIVEGRADYRLIDLRAAKAYAEYHVPTAENVPLPNVADAALARNEKLVLYGQGVVHAAQAWMVLRGRGFTAVYTLLGGLDAWKDEVLFPVTPQNASPGEQARFERTAQVARFFGGQPRAAVAPGSEPQPMAMPVAPAASDVAAPTLPAGAAATAPRKKKEGC
jgi:rhodanese-related sulfurtransferase